MQMSITFSLLLTIAFLGAQMLSFAHAAEYGSREHEHEGIACEICLNAKYQDFSSPGATSGTCVLRHAEYVPQSLTGATIIQDDYDAGVTRGPPFSSCTVNRLFIPRAYVRATEFSFQT